MALTDGLVALAVLFVFGYLFYIQLKRKYPEIANPLAELFGSPIKKQEMGGREQTKQIWQEKRNIM